MKLKVGQPVIYYNMFGRVSSIEDGNVYFATPHGSRYFATERSFDYSYLDLKEDNEHLKKYEQAALDDGKELYGGFIPEFTNTARASRYGSIYGHTLFDREEQKSVYGVEAILKIIRDLEAKNRELEANAGRTV